MATYRVEEDEVREVFDLVELSRQMDAPKGRLEVRRTFDSEIIRSTITHPKVYPCATDDGSPDAAEFQPIQHESIIYLGVWEGPDFLGLFMFVPQNFVTIEVHTCLLPDAYGLTGLTASKLAADWIWQNTQFTRITTTVPSDNRLALRFAKKSGMDEYGVNPCAWMKSGQLMGLILLGMNRPKEGG